MCRLKGTNDELFRRIATDEDTLRMVVEAECVKQLLFSCYWIPGAKITISVELANGSKATAELYDNPAFAAALENALIDFQEDMIPIAEE